MPKTNTTEALTVVVCEEIRKNTGFLSDPVRQYHVQRAKASCLKAISEPWQSLLSHRGSLQQLHGWMETSRWPWVAPDS
jgi:hypothetical protein